MSRALIFVGVALSLLLALVAGVYFSLPAVAQAPDEKPADAPELVVKTYAVGDIVVRHDDTGNVTYDAESLQEIITATIEPVAWDTNGGPGTIEVAPGDNKTLVVKQTAEVHQRVGKLLSLLRLVAQETAANRTITGYGEPFKHDPETEKLQKALARKVDLDFHEKPLGEAVAFLRESYALNVRIDKKALDDIGIGPDMPVTFRIKGIALRAALRLMLRQVDLSYLVSDGTLMIATPEAAENSLSMAVYPLGDLVGERDKSGQMTYDFEPLTELITDIVRPATWDCAGGPGSITPARFDNLRALVVSQTADVHEELTVLLRSLRAIERQAALGNGGVQPVACFLTPEEAAAKEAVERALQRKVSLQYDAAPLDGIARQVADLAGVPVQIDRKALEDLGIGTDAPVSFRVSNVSLRSALNLMLRNLDLTYEIRDEVLLITTPEVTDNSLTTTIYPVADLVVCRDSKGELWDDYDTLIDTITSTVASPTWDQAGGPGDVKGFPIGKAKVLVVSQTADVHREIAELLAKIRAVARKSPPAARPPLRDPAPPAGLHISVIPVVGSATRIP